MNFEGIKWAVRELATSFKHRPGCECAQHSRLAYVPRNAEATGSDTDKPADTKKQPASRS